MPQNLSTEPTLWRGAAPATATVGIASGEAVAANNARRFIFIKNVSIGGQRISLAFGSNAAVDKRGIVLEAGEGFTLDRGGLSREAINAISSAAAGALAIQEGNGF